jgi:transposase
VVADHDRDGAVVWAKEGRDAATLEAFYDELGDERCAALEAVSLDMGGAYKKATDARAGHARQCVDPFHLVKLANEAVDKTRRWAWNLHRDLGPSRSRWVKRTRWALLKDPDQLKDSQLAVLHELCRNRSVLYRCWQLKEAVRDLFRLADPPTLPDISTGGWRGPVAAASPPSSPSPAPCAPTATASSPPSNSACRTRNWKDSTARSGSSTTAATGTTPPPPSSP